MTTRSRSESLQRAAAFTGLTVTAVLSMRALLKPQTNDTDNRLLDWESVRENAYRRTHETGPAFHDDQLDQTCDNDARELAPLLAEVCTDAPLNIPRFQAIDRRGFVNQNIAIVQRLTGPLEQLRASIHQSRLTAVGRTATSRYVGELLGFMSGKVLGQYDPVMSLDQEKERDVPALYIVQPNLAGYVGKHGVDEHSLRRWLILHELTHAWQFGSHPWLRGYMETIIRDLTMDQILNDPGALTKHLPTVVRRQVAGVNNVQSVMSLLEGYANYVMNQVGARHLEDFKQLEESFHKRRTDRSTLERLVMAITGVNMKLRQYEIGERFCKGVVAKSDLTTLNLVWSGPTALPTMPELKQPSLWLKRVG